MPYNEPDATDPMMLHAVEVRAEDAGATRDMAECFVEEYLRDGFTADRILGLFKNPGFAGPFLAFRTLGEETIRRMIEEQMSLRKRRPSEAPQTSGTGGGMSPPVLNC